MKKRPAKKRTVTKPAARRGAKPNTGSTGITLPTSKSMPTVSLDQYISMFFGQPGVGKTTFVNSLSDKVLFLSTDRGTRFIEAMRIECLDWKTFKEVSSKLRSAKAPQYDFVCIDHVDDWARLCENYVCEKLGIESLSDAEWGKGWKVYKDEMYQFLAELKSIGIGIVFIAHETTKEVEVSGLKVDRCQPDIDKRAWKSIVPLCDLIGYCGMKPVKKGGKRVEVRTLETEPRRDLFVKDRTARNRPTGRTWEEMDGKKFLSTFTGV